MSFVKVQKDVLGTGTLPRCVGGINTGTQGVHLWVRPRTALRLKEICVQFWEDIKLAEREIFWLLELSFGLH